MMRVLRFQYWIEKHKITFVIALLAIVLAFAIWIATRINIKLNCEDTAWTGVVGTLVGALIGGTFTLMGSVWVNNRQQRAFHEMKNERVIYSPLYDELVDIQNNVLVNNPFPRIVSFHKGRGTVSYYPQYDAWRRIKLDTRYLEVPDLLKKQIEKLELTIKEYIDVRQKVDNVVQDILNDTLVANDLERCHISNIGMVISKEILLNEATDICLKSMEYGNSIEIDNKTRDTINAEIWERCNSNSTIIETRLRYKKWLQEQDYAIEMLSLIIKRILIKSVGKRL